jgi:hypothetical protein
VKTARGGVLRVEIPTGNLSLPAGFGQQTADNVILQTVLALAQRQGARPSCSSRATRTCG